MDFVFNVSLNTQYRRWEYIYQNTDGFGFGGMKERNHFRRWGQKGEKKGGGTQHGKGGYERLSKGNETGKKAKVFYLSKNNWYENVSIIIRPG